MTLAPGTRIGPYEIKAPLGAGGMGEVYRASDPRLGRDVAIKVLPAEFSADADRARRFEAEARAAAALNHPNILAVYDVGTHDGSPYIVSELLDGETLRERLAGGALPARQAVEFLSQILRGLAVAHERAIVHRDLKPDNIFVTHDARLKIFDFGVAKTTSVADGNSDVTRAPQTLGGTVLGTIGYMAPEQLRGEPVDARADVFAVGVIMYELLTGQRPFHHSSVADIISAVLHEEPTDLAAQGTPDALARIVHKCLEKNPVKRFRSAQDLAFALETVTEMPSSSTLKTPGDDRSIAVLPFENMSGDPDNQYFSDGLAEDLINALSHLPGLRVASRSSAFRFRGRDIDIKQIGRALRVATVLEGSVRRTGHHLRVTAQLVNVADGYHRWSERYDREMADVFEIQDDIVMSIINALAPALASETNTVVKRPTENLEAYEWYLKGRHCWHQRSPALMPLAMRSFEQALALDADYALAYAGLADCYSILKGYGWVSDAMSRAPAEAALKRAMAVDPTLPEVQFAQGLFLGAFDRAVPRAEPYFRRATELNPGWSIARAYYGYYLGVVYKHDEATRQVSVGLDLDPLSPFVCGVGALALLMGRAYSEAERLARRALDLQVDYLLGLAALGMVLASSRRVAEAIPVLERLVTLSRMPSWVGMLGMSYGLEGRADDLAPLERELEERRSRGEYVSPVSLVQFAIGRGDSARMQRALENCLTDNVSFGTLRGYGGPLLDEWRTDVTVDALLQQLGDGVHPPEPT